AIHGQPANGVGDKNEVSLAELAHRRSLHVRDAIQDNESRHRTAATTGRDDARKEPGKQGRTEAEQNPRLPGCESIQLTGGTELPSTFCGSIFGNLRFDWVPPPDEPQIDE
ncbi:MAG: hypothetical protein PHR35_22245, partial [Kiritimatiellae bacterium]|nr:hypothetical protein [Kiritimatiellia bacterium]